jgi:hypothetical protein
LFERTCGNLCATGIFLSVSFDKPFKILDDITANASDILSDLFLFSQNALDFIAILIDIKKSYIKK